MKMSKILSLVLVIAMLAVCFVACGDKTPDNGDESVDLTGTYDITMWVSETAGVADQFRAQIAKFMEANPGIVINAQIEGVTEADAGSKIVADVATAPDLFCFAQDQLARLVQASALAKPGKAAAEAIKANNDAGSVAAATVGGTLYAYPMTSDNGYYMYYEKSIISEEEAESLEKLIEACEKNNKKFRFALENAWYTASFFFATGCHSNWTTDEAGEFVSIDDDFNSDKGLIAMKGMQKLAQSTCYDSNADIFTDAGVIITGIWNANAAEAHFGANFGVTDLPSFTVDGTSYHLGSYSGNKLIGVKPQSDAKKAAVLSLLAQFLTNEECQNERYASFQWGPSNLKAQASDAVQANPSLAALAKQNGYAVPQGNIGGAWWDVAKVLGADAKNAKSEDDLKNGLKNYDDKIAAWLQLTPEQRRAWTVIGQVNGSNWDVDVEMKEEPANTWTATVELPAGGEFKVRQGYAWTHNFGVDLKDNQGANFKVTDAGTYKIVFSWDGGDYSKVNVEITKVG